MTAHKSPSFEPPQDQIQALLRLYHNRQFQDLFANAENLARQCPNSVLIYNILGMANASLQNSEAAIWNFQKAINAKRVIVGKGLKRSGDGLKRSGEGLSRAGSGNHHYDEKNQVGAELKKEMLNN